MDPTDLIVKNLAKRVAIGIALIGCVSLLIVEASRFTVYIILAYALITLADIGLAFYRFRKQHIQ